MKIFFTLRFFLLLFALTIIKADCFSQAAGDFQTKNAAGNWSDFNAWNIYNGTLWIAATAGQIPGVASSVYVQPAHTISVDNALAVCHDLNVNGSTGSKIAFSVAGSVLNVKGNMRLFSTMHDCFAVWTAGAKIVFSGTGAQGFTNLSANSVFVEIEVNKISGTIATTSNLRFGTFTLTAGTFSVSSGNEIQGSSGSATVNINGGLWSQITSTTRIFNAAVGNTSPIGTVTINGGSMELLTTTGTGGFQFSVVNITNGGSMTLYNFNGLISIATSISVDATSTLNTALTTTPLPPSATFNGIVNYNNTAGQTISAATYSYLKLSGTGTKTLGGNITIPANGTLEMSGVATSPTLALGGNTLTVSATGTNLIYSSAGTQTATATEWDGNFQNVTINNSSVAAVNMANLARSISGSLNLTNGNFDIGANGNLTLNGASLNRTNGYLRGTNTSDVAIIGATGGMVSLPLSANISLRNVTIAGTRTLAMNGINNIDLNGAFTIGATATYDNGGESQLTNAGGSIVINGRFLNRDKDNFTGTNGAIPGIAPTLNAGCTIEYGLTGNQLVTSRPDYKNITLSGSGIKTPSSALTPTGTLTITGSAILDATNHNIGDGVAGTTNFTMDGGRLILGTTGTQPMINGTYSLTGGVIQYNYSGLTTQTIRSPKTYYAIEVTGSNVGNSSGNITLAPGGSFTVKPGGVFMINADAIEGSVGTQTVTVENGGLFRSGNNEGFHGFVSTLSNYSSLHQNIENINLLTGSTIEYMRGGNQPITNYNGLAYQNLSIAGTGNKTAPSGILTVQGNLTKSGTSTFLHNNGTVLLNGTAAQSFAGFTYNNLLLTNSTKSTQGNSTIVDSIKINSGTVLSLSAGDTITLQSTAAKTARIGQVNGTIAYGANAGFTVERYISSRRAWRFLSVATNSVQSIKDAWQEGALVISSNPRPGYGTQITDDKINWASNGFDAMSLHGPSMKSYNPVADSYTGIASTLNTFNTTLGGYMLFIRGDRSATAFGSPVTSTVLRSGGSLFTGDQPDINVVSGQIIPVNNPYASALDLRKLSSSMNVFYYLWDPNRGGSYGLGAFQTLAFDGTDYIVVPGGGSYGAINNFIESGQGFFVGTLGADTTIKMTENAKSSATFAITPFTPVTAPGQQLRTNLHVINNEGSTTLADGVLSQFGDAYNDEIDGMDARKLRNFGENLAIQNDDHLLVLERKKTMQAKDSVIFNVTGLIPQRYQFEFIANDLDKTGLSAYLEDNYLQSRTTLQLNGTTHVEFRVNNEVASAAANRFKIVFDGAAGPVPVTFTNVEAYRKEEAVEVKWTVTNETGITHYEIEKSVDGFLFTAGATIAASNQPVNNYSWIDLSPVRGYNYYRIKSIDADGRIMYSNIVKVFIAEKKQAIGIYPNPVKNGTINILFFDQPGGLYKFRLLNKQGQVIFSKQINHSPGTGIEKIIMANVPHGIYNLQINLPDNSKAIRKLLY